METCRRHPTTPYMRVQLEGLQEQLFPGEQQMALGPLRALTEPEILDLAGFKRDQTQKRTQELVQQKKRLQRSLPRQELLAEFGIRSAEDLRMWAQVAIEMKTKKAHKERATESEDEGAADEEAFQRD